MREPRHDNCGNRSHRRRGAGRVAVPLEINGRRHVLMTSRWPTMRHLFRLGDTVTADVVIRRPLQDVYRFYRDFANLPAFLGDVVAVQQVADKTYRWVVAGPFGSRIPLTVTITEERVDRLIRYQTSGPLPHGRWELSFAPESDAGGTRVREQLVIPLGVIGRAALALIGKFPHREVATNLTMLKQVLEAGQGSQSRATRASSRRPAPRSDEERGAP
jgi:hypothetical protein